MSHQPIHISVQDDWFGLTPQILFKEVWQIAKKQLHQWRMDKAVMKNGQVVDWLQPLQLGDILTIHLRHEEETNTPAPSIPCQILYEDDHLFVVNKPAGIAVHPNHNEENTLTNSITAYLQSKGDNRKVRHVHRLDKDTTGAILFAKHIVSHAILNNMLENRTIHRTYWALVDGIVKENGQVNKAIGRDRHHPTRRRVSNTGQTAMTQYEIIEHFPREHLTLLRCSLGTGRTHQIRVHMQALGHPLAGDRLYGGSSRFTRQALHARTLEFIHPFTLEKIKITGPFIDQPPIFNFDQLD